MENRGNVAGGEVGPGSEFMHPMGPNFGKTLQDMRFMGRAGMVYGIFTCLSILGAIVGVPLIIASQRFLEGVTRFENYSRDRSGAELQAGFADLGRSFRIMKILVIVCLVLTLGYIALLFMLGGLGIMSELLAD